MLTKFDARRTVGARDRHRGHPIRDVLPTLEEWIGAGQRAALGTVVGVERSAPRLPGSVMAVSESGQVAGSVTGGCVEPAVFIQAEEVLSGGPPRLANFGYVDDEAYEVGLPCGGSVDVFIEELRPDLIAEVAEAVREERPVAYLTTIGGEALGDPRVIGREGEPADAVEAAARPLLALGETGVVDVAGERIFVSSLVPRPDMYIFGAIDFASTLATVGRFLGYRVTVSDPRALFLTPARFPDADELVTEWPQEFIARAPVDERTAICVLTHDQKFDVPALQAALQTPAGYIGAMGSRNTTDRRRAALREAGVTEEELARVHAPIGLPIGGRTPEEVAIAIGAEIVQVANAARPAEPARAGRA
jgi:xanthine dehydrogenase accessory factor